MLALDTIHCGDNCELMMQLPNECIDLVVTSPPYDDLRTYGGHSWDFFGVAWNLKRVLKPGGVIVWVVADATKNGSETGTSMEQALHFKRLGLNLHDTMIYQKLNYLPQNAPDRYDQSWEYVFILCHGRPKTANLLTKKNAKAGISLWTGGRINADGVLHDKVFREIQKNGIRHNVWPYPTGGGLRDHPAVFPLALASDFISTWSNPGDLVLDPFCGSGTTPKAAKELGRRYLGLEINPDYCAITNKRLAQQVLDLEAA